MKTWWQGLADRERRLLRFGGVIGLLLIGYLLLWEPVRQSREDWRQRALAAEANLMWMRATADEIVARRGDALPQPAADGRSLLARVDSSAREAGLGGSLLRVEPTGPDQVRVQFQQAAFDVLVGWLEELARREGVRVTEMSISRGEGVGLVDARLGLEQPAR